MDNLPLDPGSYRGTYKLVGGRSSLDFVNTVSWPDSDRSHDWLDSLGNVLQWLEAVDLPTTRCRRSDLGDIHALRATITAVLRPLAHGDRPTRPAIDKLNDYVTQFASRRAIDPTTLAWNWKPARNALDSFAPVLWDAVELISTDNHDRLRHCPSCDWLFEDRTRNGQRRWCDMADCGSRDKAHRYYHRSR
jgi:predicted RNA-binding Zn ribbon-like protein